MGAAVGRCVGAPVGSSEGMMAVGGDDGASVGASEGLLDGASVSSSEGLRMYVLMIVEVLVGLEVVCHSYHY